MSRQVLHMFYICPGHVPDISQTCPRYVQTYPRHVPDVSRHVLGVSQIYPRHDQQTSPAYVLYMSWTCPRYIPDATTHIQNMSQICPDMSLACLKYIRHMSRQVLHMFYIYPGHVPDISQTCP